MANDDDDRPEDDDSSSIPDEPDPADEAASASRDLDLDAPTPPHRGWTKPPREAVYGALWALYRDRPDLRVAKRLAKSADVGLRTAYTAIHRGWPEQGWAPLRERIKLWDKRVAASRKAELARDRKAAEEVGKTEAKKWKELNDELWPTVKGVAALLAQIQQNLIRVAKIATLVKYRDVSRFDKDANRVITVSEAYVDQSSHARAAFLVTTALKELPAAAKIILGPAAESTEPDVPQFTAEQLAKLQEGVLPPDVTYEQLGIALLRGGLQSKG